MENESLNRNTILSSLLGIALAAALIFSLWQYRKSGSLFAEKTTQEAKIDSLNAVRNGLSTNVATLGDSLADKNVAYEKLKADYDKNVALLQQKSQLATKYRGNYDAIKAISSKNSDRVTSLNNEINDLKTVKSSMEEQLKKIPVLESKIETEKKQVTEWETKYTKLTTTYDNLTVKYDDLIYRSPADNFQVEIVKSGDKITSKAKKGKQINVTFRIPDYLKTDRSEDSQVYISIFTGENQLLPGLTEDVSSTSKNGTIVKFKAHAKQGVDFSKSPQNVTFNIPVTEKLQPGTYTAKVYSATNYLGTVEFDLRDSFLFF